MIKANLRESEALYFMSYGSAIHLPKKTILASAIALCMITPGTNWLIPIAIAKITKGFTIRFDDGSSRGLC